MLHRLTLIALLALLPACAQLPQTLNTASEQAVATRAAAHAAWIAQARETIREAGEWQRLMSAPEAINVPSPK